MSVYFFLLKKLLRESENFKSFNLNFSAKYLVGGSEREKKGVQLIIVYYIIQEVVELQTFIIVFFKLTNKENFIIFSVFNYFYRIFKKNG